MFLICFGSFFIGHSPDKLLQKKPIHLWVMTTKLTAGNESITDQHSFRSWACFGFEKIFFFYSCKKLSGWYKWSDLHKTTTKILDVGI